MTVEQGAAIILTALSLGYLVVGTVTVIMSLRRLPKDTPPPEASDRGERP